MKIIYREIYKKTGATEGECGHYHESKQANRGAAHWQQYGSGAALAGGR
jgi:hypothetical protein